MTIYQGQWPNTVEIERINYPADKIETALYEFLDSAEHHESSIDAPGWGGYDWVFPASVFDAAFALTMTDKAFRAAKYYGIIRVEPTEKAEGDDLDSMTLIATDRNGNEKFRQRYVFE